MLPRGVRYANEGLAFLIELAALGFLAWWGWSTGGGLLVHLLLGLGAPLLAAAVWGRYAAPRAKVKLPRAGVYGVKAAVFGCGSAALAVLAGWPWGLAFALLCLANTALAARYRDSLFGSQGVDNVEKFDNVDRADRP
ncbi:YrdB family protein [Kitasatospora azatica]|uniref:YrdB family protein n=1 Tax=Kitasatospora azatica TaxID=58347 RepID=UPI000689E93B|nr:YrdB family protein [Kitasatospora azatica]